MSAARILLGAYLLHLAGAAAPLLWVHSPPDVSASLDASTGALLSLNTSSGLVVNTSGTDVRLGDTPAAPTLLNVSVSRCGAAAAAVCVARWLRVLAQRSDATCCVPYDVLTVVTFAPVPAPGPSAPSSLSWRLELTSSSPLPWRTSVAHALNVTGPGANASDVRVWLPRGGAATANAAWEDTLRMSDATRTLRAQYGTNFLLDDLDGREVSPVPAAVLAFASARAGLGLVAALDDALFGVAMDVGVGGAAITRRYNRLGVGRTVSFTTFIVPLAGADWRPLFGWARGAMPRYFLSSSLLVAPAAGEVAGARAAVAPAPPPPFLKTGLGLYSCANIEDMNVTQLRSSGATHNWDARFEWPYIGMYLPLGLDPPGSSWVSNTGSGEEATCGAGWKHGQNVSADYMARVYANAAAQGITTLTYFNLVEYGEDFRCPLPPPLAPPPRNDWRNASQYAADTFPDAAWPGCPNTGWQNGVDLNPADPAFASFLVAQAQAHVDALGSSFYGFAIDRFDHTSMWNHDVLPALDDGLAWCGAPCTLLLTGFIAVMKRVGDVVYGDGTHGRIITGNFVGAQRVDVLQHIDGIFTEDYQADGHMQLVMTAGLATTGAPPAMVWTYTAAEVLAYVPSADAYFAQHLLFRVSPFAPVLGNDHSVQPAMDPTGAVQSLYDDWAPLLTAAAGGCWWLVAEPVRAEAAAGGLAAETLLLNAFTVGGGCTSPRAAAGPNGPVASVVLVAVAPSFTSVEGATVVLSMADPFEGAPPAACGAATPGSAWGPLPLPTRDGTSGRWLFGVVSVARGALVVRCERT